MAGLHHRTKLPINIPKRSNAEESGSLGIPLRSTLTHLPKFRCLLAIIFLCVYVVLSPCIYVYIYLFLILIVLK